MATATVGPSLWRQALAAGAPPLDPHLSFGADASRAMTISWRTPGQTVAGQTIRVFRGGDPLDAPEVDVRSVEGAESVYSHAALTGLDPDTTYAYELVADGVVAFAVVVHDRADRPSQLRVHRARRPRHR